MQSREPITLIHSTRTHQQSLLSFGEGKDCPPKRSLKAVGLDEDPFVIFKFLYRPIGNFWLNLKQI